MRGGVFSLDADRGVNEERSKLYVTYSVEYQSSQQRAAPKNKLRKEDHEGNNKRINRHSFRHGDRQNHRGLHL
jgi:hypothetical protein